MDIKIIFLFVCIAVCAFVLFKVFIKDFNSMKRQNPLLLNYTMPIKNYIIPSKKILRSVDGKRGLEFSYGFWLNLNPPSQEFENIFLKGKINNNNNCNGMNNIQCPGVWLNSNSNGNNLIINFDTYYPNLCEVLPDLSGCSKSKYNCNSLTSNTCLKDSLYKISQNQKNTACILNNKKCINQIKETVIMKVPLNKWIHVTIVVANKNVDTYLNGRIIGRHIFKGIPKQNNNNLIIGACNSANGNIANLQYFNSAVSYPQIEAMINTRPLPMASLTPGTDELPKYLNQNYWISN